ncbi:hypothetical protein A3D80_03205 [Candidatus Roizmanbacteria bacterium RIFCSPHIGHO2_02_FULL_40_13b]|uniref:BioF2-like acetyltransferase domain-containing protein n=1 Tax=Candidatus Roizmanbacteria bacterium RIFCSPHIGHO2_01_FULL_39_24 TaxID=1802032 RepID=A0A1F7GLE5_9BACT|nr:MAG: hypothetical protein A2799_00950 [Candidatus Roizmanbacteria bacterium RIFCSPHIGHO2_01_FULL_39_24]OGK26975.1 MAG: hypothetical protein A3D80_03205 [Candidatus Roizmanbacteria bacterium RIFCSPHIGHO2_02_FULL_40_13b]OGK48870.1 MAG: hypothetical protein A3A56_01520 [Candidatus Roizmanbacteria bacterium RIFCSPLOWO2_01_FULL_40_32]OGK57513.1 MAG: hypothetical protein A3H83_00910 [Candidatus Roizmanbacteria bacterium RIFCSPLOWO2_02_FULL_39_8]
MKIEIIKDDFDREKYNRVAPHPLQSWEWGEARKKMGIEVLRIGEFRDDVLKNVFQVTFHKIPKIPFKIGYLPRSVFPNKDVLHFLQIGGQRRNCIFIKVEPYVEKGQPSQSYHPHLVKSPHPLFPKWTQMLDLRLSEEELMKKLKPKTRYNIKVAQKNGIVVREMTNETGFNVFVGLYFGTASRQQYYGHNKKYHETIFNNFKEGIAHILIAFRGNTPLASYELFTFNDVLYYPYGGSSVDYRNLMAPNLLMWEAILFGKKHGCTRFDMWGSLPPNYEQNDPWAGFTRFKEGYGTKFVELVSGRDLIVSPLLYNIYNIAYNVRKKVMRMG